MYEKEKFLRLVKKDKYLEFVWKDQQKMPKEDHDMYLEAMFNSYVLEDSVMMKAYEAA